MQKFKKGDTVIITIGKDKGQKGPVEKVWPKEHKLIVKGKNIYKKHTKAQGEGQKGGIIEKSRPFVFSKVALLCPKCQKKTRVGFQLNKDGKTRICKKCGQVIS